MVLCLMFPRRPADHYGPGHLRDEITTSPRFMIDHPTTGKMSALYFECLQGLPETSDAFSTHPKILNTSKNKGSVKPPSSTHPRKTPKLTRDADSASASRSRGVGTSFASGNTGNTRQDDGDVIMRDVADEDIVVSAVLKVEGAPCTFLPIHHLAAHPNAYVILDKPAPLDWPIFRRMQYPRHQVPSILPHKTPVSRSRAPSASEFLI
jgi:hypothetical protein